MSIRNVMLVACTCDLCGKAGLPSQAHDAAEAAAEVIGITRFMGGRHCCSECRAMIGREKTK